MGKVSDSIAYGAMYPLHRENLYRKESGKYAGRAAGEGDGLCSGTCYRTIVALALLPDFLSEELTIFQVLA